MKFKVTIRPRQSPPLKAIETASERIAVLLVQGHPSQDEMVAMAPSGHT